MTELMILKENLRENPLFHALCIQAESAQEALEVASGFGVQVSIDDIRTYRKELRGMISKQSFHLEIARSDHSFSSFSGGGDMDASGAWATGPGGCSDYGGGDFGGGYNGGECAHL